MSPVSVGPILRFSLAPSAIAGCTTRPSVSRPGNAAGKPFDVKAHYDKAAYRVPMRDSVRLFTVVYSPKDRSRTYPILLIRTPYSAAPYGAEEYRPASRL